MYQCLITSGWSPIHVLKFKDLLLMNFISLKVQDDPVPYNPWYNMITRNSHCISIILLIIYCAILSLNFTHHKALISFLSVIKVQTRWFLKSPTEPSITHPQDTHKCNKLRVWTSVSNRRHSESGTITHHHRTTSSSVLRRIESLSWNKTCRKKWVGSEQEIQSRRKVPQGNILVASS